MRQCLTQSLQQVSSWASTDSRGLTPYPWQYHGEQSSVPQTCPSLLVRQCLMIHDMGAPFQGPSENRFPPHSGCADLAQCHVSSSLPALLYQKQLVTGVTKRMKSLSHVKGEAHLQGKVEVRAVRASLPLSAYLHLWRDGEKHLAAEDGWYPGQDNSQHKGISRKCHQGQRLCVDLLEELKNECKAGRQQAERCCEPELKYELCFSPISLLQDQHKNSLLPSEAL